MQPTGPSDQTRTLGMLTDAQTAKAESWIKTKWENASCPFHGQTHWSYGDRLLEMRPFDNGSITLTQEGTAAFLVVTCTTCGYTVLVNAIVAGILSPRGGSGV